MKKNILIIGYSNISKKHLNLIRNKNKYKPYIISKHLKNDHFLNKINFDQAQKKYFDFAIICGASSERIKNLYKIKNNCNKFFLEKPIADKYEKIIKLKNNRSLIKKIYVGYVFRHNNLIKKLKKLITNQRNGKFLGAQIISRSYLPNWRKHISYKKSVSAIKSKGGGVLLELSHEIDLTLYLFGKCKIKSSVLSNSGTLGINVEERADIILRSKDSSCINILLDFNSKFIERKIIINFSKLTLEANLEKNYINLISEDNIKKFKFKNEKKLMFKRQMDNFKKNKVFPNSFKDSSETLKIIHKIKYEK
jgi:hypothetical protein